MSSWPNDNLPRKPPFELDPGLVRAYFLSPSENRYQFVETALRNALDEACRTFGLTGELERAVSSKSPAIIHDEIWNWLYNADLLVFDITGENASVMMEFGIAAAWRLKPQVIVVQDKEHQKPLPFNLKPARVFRYALTPAGILELQREMQETFQICLATMPLAAVTQYPREEIFPFTYPSNAFHLISPPLCHRYQRPDGGLEFGAPIDFRHSFLLPYTGYLNDVSMSAEMSFAYVADNRDPNSYWIGVKVLSSGTLMNFGVGTVLYPTGKARLTYVDGTEQYRDPLFDDQLSKVVPEEDRILFKVVVSGSTFTAEINHKDQTIERQLDLGAEAGYRPTSGVCLIQAYGCRGILWSLSLDQAAD